MGIAITLSPNRTDVNIPADENHAGYYDCEHCFLMEIDEKGRVNVSAKDLLPKPDKKVNKESK